MKNSTKLCSTKPIVTVNGQFPGPTLVAREDDTVLVKVVNHVKYNLSIHWHGIRQLRTGWADGPAYITQCPIQPGQNFVYNFTITGQRGTLLWHAHILWLRATVHGAIVILPKRGVPYPFPTPHKEKVILLGEWWKSDVEAVINEATKSGVAPNVSDAHTINGHPGPVSACSSLASPFMDAPIAVDNVTATATLHYSGTLASITTTLTVPPAKNATAVATSFTNALRSLNSIKYPARVPLKIDHSLFFTIGLGINPCATCKNGSRVVADINNVTFVMPKIALLQAHVFNISGVFTDDFPANPPTPFNYTGTQPTNFQTENGTKLYRLGYNNTTGEENCRSD
ncbi:MULTI-COPPER OXIDASE [Salix koriyanagi]|nr:MULTI-COPPER OXIDASE [Salix koriyanagi]